MVSRSPSFIEQATSRAAFICAASFACATLAAERGLAQDSAEPTPDSAPSGKDGASRGATKGSPTEGAVETGEAPSEASGENESEGTGESEDRAEGPSEAASAEGSEATAPSEPDEPSLLEPERKESDYTMVDTSVVTRMTTPGEVERRSQDSPSTRWSEVGGFVGMVSRASSSSRFKYLPGVAYGGYFRPQLNKYLGVRIFYREERIGVDARPGAYDYGGESHDLDLEQPKLKITSLGVRIEPSYPITPFLHLVGVFSWSWARMVARMPEAEDFQQRADRAAVELNWGLGAGIEVDLLKNWLSLSCMGAYHFVSNQTGTAYEPIQAIVDGQMTPFAPLAPPKNMVDVLFSIGLIL